MERFFSHRLIARRRRRRLRLRARSVSPFSAMPKLIGLTLPVADHSRRKAEGALKAEHARGDRFQITWFGWTVHDFTHVDAPRHMLAKGTELTPDVPELHCPVAHVTEIVDVLYPRERGGVFVVVGCATPYAREILRAKGHVTNRSGDAFLITRAHHLWGVETPLRRAAAGGETINREMIEPAEEAPLWKLRRQQDAAFFPRV